MRRKQTAATEITAANTNTATAVGNNNSTAKIVDVLDINKDLAGKNGRNGNESNDNGKNPIPNTDKQGDDNLVHREESYSHSLLIEGFCNSDGLQEVLSQLPGRVCKYISINVASLTYIPYICDEDRIALWDAVVKFATSGTIPQPKWKMAISGQIYYEILVSIVDGWKRSKWVSEKAREAANERWKKEKKDDQRDDTQCDGMQTHANGCYNNSNSISNINVKESNDSIPKDYIDFCKWVKDECPRVAAMPQQMNEKTFKKYYFGACNADLELMKKCVKCLEESTDIKEKTSVTKAFNSLWFNDKLSHIIEGGQINGEG